MAEGQATEPQRDQPTEDKGRPLRWAESAKVAVGEGGAVCSRALPENVLVRPAVMEGGRTQLAPVVVEITSPKGMLKSYTPGPANVA